MTHTYIVNVNPAKSTRTKLRDHIFHLKKIYLELFYADILYNHLANNKIISG